MARERDAAIARRSRPATIVSGNGTEFTSIAILGSAQEVRIAWRYIAPGKPNQKAFAESFNGRLRYDFLNETLIVSLVQAHAALAAWQED